MGQTTQLVWNIHFALLIALGTMVRAAEDTSAAHQNTLRLALLQSVPKKWDLDANFKIFLEAVEIAAQGKADLVITPECWLDGYASPAKDSTAEKIRSVAQDLEGSIYLKQVAQKAKEHRIFICFGFTSFEGGQAYNAAGLWDKAGKRLGIYHKTHLQAHDLQYATGQSLPVWQTPWGSVGIMICADRRWPETARVLRLQGARLILNPTYGFYGDLNEAIMRTRAYENQCFIAFAHPRQSLVTGPNGKVIARHESTKESGNAPHVTFCDLDLSLAKDDNHLRDRRPEIYRILTRPAESFPVTIRVNAGETKGALKPIWRFFGSDEPNYAYMRDGKKLLKELGELAPKHVYFRTHNLLSSGDGTPALKWGSTGAYREDSQGKPLYDWTILDRIFDAYLERQVRPYVQIGFMPKDLSVKPEPYQHEWKPGDRYDKIYTGWAYPPKDYARWAELVFQWTKHNVEKHGKSEVESWYWQVWNEPNIPYWKGTAEEFQKLHDYAIDAVRRALPTARVGGPDTAGSGGKFTRAFLEHCLRGTNFATGKIGTPIDFVSFHAKGAPTFTNGHVRMGIASQLRTIDDGFRIVASFPELKSKPIVIGESDPDGCAACSADVYPQNGYRNGTLYSSYTAASFARKHELADKHGVNLDGALTWAFEFEDQPYFAGFRALASNGLDLPVLNVFRMFSKMTGRRVAVQSDSAVPLESLLTNGVREKPDVSALASIGANALSIFVWHYHDEDVPGPNADIELGITHLPFNEGPARLEEFRIDDQHSNAFAAWKNTGAPQRPSAEQYAELERAGQLNSIGPVRPVSIRSGEASLRLSLPRQAVSLLQLSW